MARKRISDSIASSIFHTVDAGASPAKPMICGRNSEGVRDQAPASNTQRSRDIFTFVSEHTDREEFSWSLQQFRPYVLMMNTRAKASILLGQGKFAEAMGEIERGRDAITEFLQQSNFPELVSKSSEIAFLEEWLEEVKAKRPLSKLEIMQREMQTAIAKELYERAAELRDAIKLLQTRKH